MHLSYRWCRLSVGEKPVRFAAFRQALNAYSDAGSWFSVEEDGTSRFFRKVYVSIDRVGAGGENVSEQVESVVATNVRLIRLGQESYLRIENPGRNIRALMGALELAFGFGFSARKVDFSDFNASSVMRSFDVAKLVAFRVTNIVFGTDCVGRIELASRGGIELKKIDVLKGRRYSPDFAKYELLYRGVAGYVSYSSSGVVKVGGKLADFVLARFEEEIPNLH